MLVPEGLVDDGGRAKDADVIVDAAKAGFSFNNF